MPHQRLHYRVYPVEFDCNEDARLLDEAALGFLQRCLNHAWANRGLPANPEEIERVIPGRRTHAEFTERWAAVSKFFVPSPYSNRLVNPDQEKQRGRPGDKIRREHSGGLVSA
jgi:hypothetical protein